MIDSTVVPGNEIGEITTTTAVTSTTQTSTAMSQASTSSSIETNVSQATATPCSLNQETVTTTVTTTPVTLASGTMINARPGSMVRVPEMANGRKSIMSFLNKNTTKFCSVLFIFEFFREYCALSSTRRIRRST